MADDSLFVKVEKFLGKKEELSRMEEELISSVEKEIIQVEYELQKIMVSKTEGTADDEKYFEVYYPVLRYNETFTKEDETFYKAELTDDVIHEYILSGIGTTTLKVKEKAYLYHELLQKEEGLLICNNYATGSVQYTVLIRDDLEYTYVRKFDEDIVEQGKNELFVLKDNCFENENIQNERSFRVFLSTIGSSSSITLAEIMNSCNPAKSIQLTGTISARFSIEKKNIKRKIWLKNSKLGFCVNNWKIEQRIITISAEFSPMAKLEKQRFRMLKAENEETFRNGVTFEEAMKLILPKEKKKK